MKTPKQTSANNKFLAAVKKMMNHKIYKRTMQLLNTPGSELSGGMPQALVYLQQFFTVPINEKFFLEK